MKKLLLLFLSFSIVIISCTEDDDVDLDTIGQTFEIGNINFISNNNLNATVNVVIPNNINVFESDVPWSIF